MRRLWLLICGPLSLGIQACSVHPLQQDVTGYSTVALVDHIRCEARHAIEKKAIKSLYEYNKNNSRNLAIQLSQDEIRFRKFSRNDLQDKVQKDFYDRYINRAIALSFTFDVKEINKNSATIDFARPFSGGNFALGIGASADFSRQNERRFIVSDTFEQLLRNKSLKCNVGDEPENLIYPISGSIGLAELINTFVDLNEDDELKYSDKSDYFADTLTFTTTVGASIAPNITFISSALDFHVQDAPLSGSHMRTDRHEVIVGLIQGNLKGKSPTSPRKTSFVHGPLVGAATPASPQGGEVLTRGAIDVTILQRLNTFFDRSKLLQ